MRTALRCALAFLPALSIGCGDIPTHTHTSPKSITADGQDYLACEGLVRVYDPPRGVASSSSSHLYEIVFQNEYGKEVDLTDVKTYTIRDAPADASYAMAPNANAGNRSSTYSDGQPLRKGETVVWGKGEQGRAIWLGPGQWTPTPCAGTF
jgi:hypothetical protein